MATAEEVRDALLERIAYHSVSADVNDVLVLAKAWDVLTGGGEDEEDDEEDDED